MSDDKLVELLATYLTGSNVAAASIGLELGGHARTLAEPFFALRSALGINGYATRGDAIEALQSRASMEGEIERLREALKRLLCDGVTPETLAFARNAYRSAALTSSKTGDER